MFDHRGFGASGGEPRQHEDAAGKLEDLRSATSALAAHPAVDAARLGCVGVCLGGGYALRHSAFDPRIRAVAFVAAAFNDPTVQERSARSGNFPVTSTPEEFAAFIAEEAERWGKALKDIGLKYD